MRLDLHMHIDALFDCDGEPVEIVQKKDIINSSLRAATDKERY